MGEYIEREATVKLLRSLGSRDYRKEKGTIQDAIKMISFPEYTPAADVAPVRREHWDGYTRSRFCGFDEYGDPVYRDGVVYYCSNKKCRRKTVIREKYCPSCGAIMDGGDGNDKP